jgi:shikimate dehydrogenase
VPRSESLLRPPSGRTRVAGVIGDPVAHSLSPALHNAAFAALGLDWVYVAFPVANGSAGSAVGAMRALGIAGLSVTMPHKAEVVDHVDRLGPVAKRLGVVNTISWAGSVGNGDLEGESTDGSGFIDALKGDDGFDPAGRSCVVLGTGGAARAVVLALAGASARSVVVVGRRAEAAYDCSTLADGAGSVVEAVGPEGRAALAGVISEADLLVNATPVGMGESDGIPFDVEPVWIRPGQFVADLIYSPATTPLVSAARSRGATAVNGLGMLIHQAGRQLEMWTRRPAPLEAMSAAALSALAHRNA